MLEPMCHRLTGMRVKKIIDGSVQFLAGTCQVAAQPGGDEIIVDDVRGKPGRIRRLRETLADALHGRSELPGMVSSAAGSSAAIERQVNAANKSAAARR